MKFLTYLAYTLFILAVLVIMASTMLIGELMRGQP